MYHYLTNIVGQSEVIADRQPLFFEAGYNRVMFISNAIDTNVQIVSMGAGAKKGFFQRKIEIINPKIKIYYLPQVHLTLFKKKLRHFFYSFFLFSYLIKNVNKGDKLIVYNVSKSLFMIVPVLLFKFFKKTKYILEIEELYSYKRNNNKLKYSERVSIKFASGCVIVSPKIQKFINSKKPTLLNAGYYNFNDSIKSIRSKNEIVQIVYSGRLDDYSGIDILLNSLKYIDFKCRLIVTGKGSFETYVRNFKNTNPLVEFKYLGILDKQSYHELLLNSDIAVNPIRSNLDFSDVSFPSKVLQYLTYGLVVISSKIDSLVILGDLNRFIHTYSNDSDMELANKLNFTSKKDLNISNSIIANTKEYFEKSSKQLNVFF